MVQRKKFQSRAETGEILISSMLVVQLYVGQEQAKVEPLTVPFSKGMMQLALHANIRIVRGAQKLAGENLKVVWPSFQL